MPMLLAASLELAQTPFEKLKRQLKCHLLGVPYVHVRTDSGDDLFLTERGWPWLQELLPENWYQNKYYKSSGTRLRFSSGAVYRVAILRPRHLQVVVKFSRMGQYLDPSHLAEGSASRAFEEPSFSSPFEEVAALDQLRKNSVWPRILTKRALAIFSPKERYQDWQLGRQAHQFERHARKLLASQTQQTEDTKVALDPARDYVLVFHWSSGLNLEECVEQGRLSQPEVEQINRMVLGDLERKGFEILDHKPNHVIVRFRRDGSLLQRQGRVTYALADFELLKVTEPGSDSTILDPPRDLRTPSHHGPRKDHGPVAT